MLIYFLKGSLPWQNLKAKTKNEKYWMIRNHKENIDWQELEKDIPSFLFIILNVN